MKTTITRDTNTSFFKVVTSESGNEFSIKIQKGSTEYVNACALFNKNNVEIVIGNKVN